MIRAAMRFDFGDVVRQPFRPRAMASPNVDGILGGLRVCVSPDRPGYQLPEELPLPPQFRMQFNAWAAGFFNPVQFIPDGDVIHDKQNGTLYMNERTLAMLKKTCSEHVPPIGMKAR